MIAHKPWYESGLKRKNTAKMLFSDLPESIETRICQIYTRRGLVITGVH